MKRRTPEEIRKAENARVEEMVKNGESLGMVDMEAVWFPIRKPIPKDKKLIARTLGDADSERGE